MADQFGLVAAVRRPRCSHRPVAKRSGSLLHLHPPALVRLVYLYPVFRPPVRTTLLPQLPGQSAGCCAGSAATESRMTRRGIVALIVVISIDVVSMYWIAHHLVFS